MSTIFYFLATQATAGGLGTGERPSANVDDARLLT
jgi:hypothetical protein